MCLAVPGQILSVTGEADDALGRLATVDFQGSRMEASLAMTPEAGAGDWVLVHAGYAITQLDEAEARETWETLRIALGEDFELPGGEAGA
ncbi:MAG: HypC/HybG/HupF family hydrogenase formation chaperone [Candidatus Krumholzibacteriia bacterium]|nr:HypC/HybG/HupF family hydrogenase formation chaperone [bacterium]MCB9514445.1 HypC/HybG/HupF family hydrogenase formation chaperone [Candidatus Latescibacterota bacterium]MCB9517249.1 HypC/HybG/HupF family hydrogenase formation chaperone [Candidatus Latescibacterota bacterium]